MSKVASKVLSIRLTAESVAEVDRVRAFTGSSRCATIRAATALGLQALKARFRLDEPDGSGSASEGR